MVFLVNTMGVLEKYNGSNTSLIIPRQVKNVRITCIASEVFRNNDLINDITISDSITSIDTDAFSDCQNLRNIRVNKENTAFSDNNGVLFDKEQKILIYYPPGKSDSCYAIPDSVTLIEEQAFSCCSSLSSITIPNSVTLIGSMAFAGCSSLSSVIIPDSITLFEEDVFSYCSSLSSIIRR